MILRMPLTTARERRGPGSSEGAKPSCGPPVLSPMPRISLLALMALLALPVSAHAAEGFVGVTERGSVVRFTSESPSR